MKYTMNFGRLPTHAPKARRTDDAFRIAVLGDFSGRANARAIETAKALAHRQPIIVDIDNLDAAFRRWNPTLSLPIGADGATLGVKIESLDDFHPDQLFNKLEVFRELSEIRQQLRSTSTFAAAAAAMQSWPDLMNREPATSAPLKPRGVVIPPGKLTDFARLIGQSQPPSLPDSPVDELVRQVVAPYVVPASHPDQRAMLAAVDAALSTTMRRILHHPDFQALESLWRSVDLLTRELETDGQLQVILYDITAEEIAADLSTTDNLASTGLYQLVKEAPFADQRLGPFSVLVGNYIFELTPPHAELLGRIAKIAAVAQAPFIAGISNDCLIQRGPSEVHPLITESWSTLRQMPHANYIGLPAPRFMLRWPYGAATEPIESFDFEEFTLRAGLSSMLWANGSILVGILLGKTFDQQGLLGMRLGNEMVLGDVPFYFYTDSDGDQLALPSTERNVTESAAVHMISQNFMPVLSTRGRTEIRLGSFTSLGGAQLAGPWALLDIPAEEQADLAAAITSSPTAAPETDSVEEVETRAAADAERELDALLENDALNSMDSEEELNALLASVPEKAASRLPVAERSMDPNLAALLDEL